MADLLPELALLMAWDFAIAAYDGWTLSVVAGSPLDPCNPALTIRFGGVRYLRCPTEFHHARFRPASAEEWAEISDAVAVEESDVVIAFDAVTQARTGPRAFVVVAESCDVLPCVIHQAVQCQGPDGSVR